MYTRRCVLWALLVSALLAGQEPAQTVQVTGAVKQLLNLSPVDLSKMPRASKDKPGARSVRMLTKVEVVQLKE